MGGIFAAEKNILKDSNPKRMSFFQNFRLRFFFGMCFQSAVSYLRELGTFLEVAGGNRN